MTVTLTVASSKQVALLAEIERRRADNKKDAIGNVVVAAGALAVSVGLAVLFPPAGVAGFISSVAGFASAFSALDLLKNYGSERGFVKAKQELATDPAHPKLAERTATLKKWTKRLALTGLGLTVGALAVMGAAFVAPAVIPLAVASPLFVTGIYSAAGLLTVNMALRGARDASVKINSLANLLAPASGAAPATGEAPAAPGLAKAVSPQNGFTKAANANTAKAQLVVEMPRKHRYSIGL